MNSFTSLLLAFVSLLSLNSCENMEERSEFRQDQRERRADLRQDRREYRQDKREERWY